MSWKRNVRGINGIERMDREVPPEPFETEHKPLPSKAWKKKYKCKKLKGDHAFVVDKIHPRKYFPWREKDDQMFYIDWRCSGCGKRELEWSPPDKKFEQHRGEGFKLSAEALAFYEKEGGDKKYLPPEWL